MALKISPILRYTVTGNSMHPAYPENAIVIVNRLSYKATSPKVGDVVVLKHPREDIYTIKRVTKRQKGRFFVEGDNKKASTDSRAFGYIDKKNIIGKVVTKPFDT